MTRVYEGDQLNILCKVNGLQHSDESVRLLLIQGIQILSSGLTNVSHSMVAQANYAEEFECKFEMGNVVKTATKTISVIGEWTEVTTNLCSYRCHVFGLRSIDHCRH